MLCTPGYETDERSSLGKRGERRRGREERPERSAAVYIFKAALTAAENIGHRKPGCRTDEGNLSGQAPITTCCPQPTMRTEKDIGSENPETTAVSGFCYAIF